MTDRELLPALRRHLEALSDRLGNLGEPVEARIAGGIAVNYYTGHRMSDDVDIEWSHRVPIPPDMQVFEVPNPDDPHDRHLVAMDGGFSDAMGSFPPDWGKRAREVSRAGNIVILVMDPVDLAVSKVARFSDRDREDIRQLAAHGLVDPLLFAERMEEALDYYVGDTTFVRHNFEEAKEIVAREGDAPEPP